MAKEKEEVGLFEYNEDSIKSLDWKEHIRLRPGMYIGKLGDGSSPDDGIYVELEQDVKQGEVLGITGKSGLAGYPHLHFIVVKYPPEFPYSGIAVSFSNALPADVVLQGDTQYKAVAY